MKKREEIILNPESRIYLAYFVDPLYKSLFYLFAYFLSLFVSFYLENFDFFKIATNSLINELLGFSKICKHLCLIVYIFQCLVVTIGLVIYLMKFVSCGNRLTHDLLENTNLGGKVALVTGGYSGIGLEISLQLLRWNCKVVILGRSKTKATNAIEYLKNAAQVPISRIDFVEMDFNDIKSIKLGVKKILNDYTTIDFLINNAGISKSNTGVTPFGYEEIFTSNHLGHYYLTNSLFDIIIKSETRVINMSSIAHFRYNPNEDDIFNNGNTMSLKNGTSSNYYSRSKLYNIWFTHSLQRRFGMNKRGPMCLSCAPGIVRTRLLLEHKQGMWYKYVWFLYVFFLKKPQDGAATALYLVCAPKNSLVPGAYYYERKLGFVSYYAHDYDKEEKLCKLSDEIIEKILKS